VKDELCRGLAFASDGRQAYAYVNDRFQLWDTVTGKLVRSFKIDVKPSVSAKAWFSRDARRALVLRDREFLVVDLAAEEVIYQRPFFNPSERVEGAALTPDGRVLLMGVAKGEETFPTRSLRFMRLPE